MASQVSKVPGQMFLNMIQCPSFLVCALAQRPQAPVRSARGTLMEYVTKVRQGFRWESTAEGGCSSLIPLVSVMINGRCGLLLTAPSVLEAGLAFDLVDDASARKYRTVPSVAPRLALPAEHLPQTHLAPYSSNIFPGATLKRRPPCHALADDSIRAIETSTEQC